MILYFDNIIRNIHKILHHSPYILLQWAASNSASTLDLLKAFSVAISASTLDLLIAAYLYILDASISASILDLLKASSLATRSAAISA